MLAGTSVAPDYFGRMLIPAVKVHSMRATVSCAPMLNEFSWPCLDGRPPLSADIRPVFAPCGLCCNPVALFSHETGLLLKSDELLRVGVAGYRVAWGVQTNKFGGVGFGGPRSIYTCVTGGCR